MNTSLKVLLCLQLLFASATSCGSHAGGITVREAAALHFQVDERVAVPEMKRVGLNLGSWTAWGAEQLCANVLKNPGFEGMIDRAIVIVGRAVPGRFSDDAGWLGRADGFWAGASYEVLSGRSAGRRGRLIDSHRTGEEKLPEYIAEDGTLLLGVGDVVSLTLISDEKLPALWWVPEQSAGLIAVERNDRRPGSTGARSLALTPTAGRAAEIISYLDAISERAGKMLPVAGAWRLTFWSRAPSGGAQLYVEFGRASAPLFLSKTVTVGRGWTKTTLDFEARDDGPAGLLGLRLQAGAGGGRLLLDDVELEPAQAKPFPFRKEVVELLRRLRPGYLRDWQGQLGDTLANRLVNSFARRTARARPEADEKAEFHYSLPDFLSLCKLVGANPWVIIPPAFTQDELKGLGRFLAARQKTDGFEEIVLEFGNENWNPLFRPGAIPDARAHGEAAQRAFVGIREGAGGHVPLKLVVNGQHANPEAALAFLRQTPSADVLAVAPYFFTSMRASVGLDENLAALFAGDGGRLRGISEAVGATGKELAVYEVNLHTTGGDATASKREPLTAGAAAGSALAKTLLDSMSLGARRQCVYAFAGYDAFADDGKKLVKLWGVTRDLGETRRLRPQGLALMLINRAVGGDLYAYHMVDSVGDERVSLGVFRPEGMWTAAVASAASVARQISITFPADESETPRTMRLLLLDAPSPTSTNEDREEVRIKEETVTVEHGTATFNLPAYGMAVLVSGTESYEH